MKTSIYNLYIELNSGEVLAYNTMSCMLGNIGGELYNMLCKINPGQKIPDDYKNHAAFYSEIDKLEKGGFVIGDDIDEIEQLKEMQQYRRFQNNNLLNITIAPTLDCNFNCIYCYENAENNKNDRVLMTKDIADSVIEYIDDYFTNGGELNVAWFGGEPTLALDMVYYISNAIAGITAKKHIKNNSYIVTNGYLLDRIVANELSQRGISQAIISVDGCCYSHDSRRPLKNGEGTFDVIIKNIKNICDIIEVSIKVTLDRENCQNVNMLLDTLEDNGIKDKVNLEATVIEAYEYSCDSVKRNALLTYEFANVYSEFMKTAIERHFRVIPFPLANRYACSAICNNSLVVGPKGELHKCVNTLGRDDEVFGSIQDVNHKKSESENYTKWMSQPFYETENCLNCKVLPMCMGSRCVRNKILKYAATLNGESSCTQFKYNIEQLIKHVYASYKTTKH